MVRPPRPYVRSALKLNYYVDENAANSESILNKLINVLCKNGFRRKIVKKRTPKSESKLTEQNIALDNTVSVEKVTINESDEPKKNSNFAMIGLKSVLRAINLNEFKQIDNKFLGEKILATVILDADLIKPSAVGNVFALAALNHSYPFYVLKNLSTTLKKSLNLPRVSALALWQIESEETCSIVKDLCDSLKPIGTAKITKNSNKRECLSTFCTPTVTLLKGKSSERKNKSKKKKRK